MDKFCDLDYFFTKDSIVYLTRGYYHTPNSILACPVFWPNKQGDRLHPQYGHYIKNTADFNEKIFILHPEYRHESIPRNFPLVPRSDLVKIYCPREKTRIFLEKEQNNIWHNIILYLTDNLLIPLNDIGIFGSYLVNLNKNTTGEHIKDIDLAIYGLDNCRAIKNNIETLLDHFGFSHISKDHIDYHVKKFGKYLSLENNTLSKTLANKWSSIQIAPGLLNTLRFVYKDGEIPQNPIPDSSVINNNFKITGQVVSDIGSNFMPRVFIIETGGQNYTIVTYFWAFQSCVKNGDRVIITGNLHPNRTVGIDDAHHGIKII